MMINIPLQIDDAAIEGKLTKDYESKVLESVNDRIDKVFMDHDDSWGTRRSANTGLEKMIDNRMYDRIDSFLDTNKDRIIEEGAKALADRLARTKKGKAILEKYEEVE